MFQGGLNFCLDELFIGEEKDEEEAIGGGKSDSLVLILLIIRNICRQINHAKKITTYSPDTLGPDLVQRKSGNDINPERQKGKNRTCRCIK